jgi:hypothetical protein
MPSLAKKWYAPSTNLLSTIVEILAVTASFVWLKAVRYPRLAGAPAVLLESHSFAGVDAFEPLYGARATCTVKGVASGNEADAV